METAAVLLGSLVVDDDVLVAVFAEPLPIDPNGHRPTVHALEAIVPLTPPSDDLEPTSHVYDGACAFCTLHRDDSARRVVERVVAVLRSRAALGVDPSFAVVPGTSHGLVGGLMALGEVYVPDTVAAAAADLAATAQRAYTPPSVLAGTVAPGLVEALERLGDEYGPAGVAELAAEFAAGTFVRRP